MWTKADAETDFSGGAKYCGKVEIKWEGIRNGPPDPSVSGSIETRENLRTNTASKPGSKPAEGCLYFKWSWKACAGKDSE